MKKARLYFMALVAVLIALHISVFIKSMGLSVQVDLLEKETKALRVKNIDLEAYVYRLGSLATIASQAAALGFEKNKSTLYLRDGEVAHRPSL